ncbi:hypothetical protein BC830DRAFT_741586 [Chytriomyces sp. MP71]|nr:hypothetical protein BC830DRAFT_741586 [Chytriomyces sp. MP71]
MRQRKNFNHSHEPAHQQRLLNSSRGEQPANPEKSASDQGTSSLSPAESNVSIHPKFLQFHPAFHVETGGSFQPQQLQELQRQQHVSPLQRQLPPLSAPGSPPKPMPTLPPLSMAAAGLNASPILPPPVAIQAQQEFHQNRNPYQHTPGQQQTPRSFMEHEYHQSHSRIHHVQAVTDYQQCQNQPQYHHATAGSSSYGDSRYGTYTGNNSQLPFPSVQHSQHISTGVSVSPYPSSQHTNEHASQPKQDHVRSQLLSSGPQFHHSSSHSDPTHSMQHVYHQQPSSNQQNQPYQTHLPYPSHLPNPCPQLQQQQYQHQHQGALRYQPDPPRFDSRHHQHPHHNPYQSSMTSTSTQNNHN